MAFHDRLKEARIKSGYTQDQLAEMLGIGKSTLSGYENGNREPAIATVAKIIDLLNIDANYLYQDEVISSTNISYEDIDMNKKYRDLDSHGKEMVDFTLSKEYDRSIAEKVKQNNMVPITVKESTTYEINAAHADDYMGAPDELKKQEEDMMDSF